MKHSVETSFSVDNKIIGYADEFQGEYVMRFVDPMPKLHALAKPTKDLTTWHARVAHLGYKNLLCMRKYVMVMDEVSGSAPDEICGWCMMGRQQQEISRTPTKRSTVFLDLLHFDLEGPLPRTFRGFRYFLLVKDDVTALMFTKCYAQKQRLLGSYFTSKLFWNFSQVSVGDAEDPIGAANLTQPRACNGSKIMALLGNHPRLIHLSKMGRPKGVCIPL